jgi:GTP-binding protein EngB required for normal cell division
VLLADARRGLEEEEQELLEWLDAEGIPAAVALTKADKLSRLDAARRVRAVLEQSGRPADRVGAVSSRTADGLELVAAWIREWTGVRFAGSR